VMGDFRVATPEENRKWSAPVGYTFDRNGNIVPKSGGSGVSAGNLRSIFGDPSVGSTGETHYAGIDQHVNGNPSYVTGQQGFGNVVRNQETLAQGDLNPFQKDVFRSEYLVNPNTAMADPSKQYFNGDPRFAANQASMLQAQATGAMGRAGPMIDTSGMQPWQMGAQGSLGQMGQAGANLSNQGYQLNNVATGAGYQGQLGAAQGLMGMSQMPAGPSVAEQAMRMQSAQNEHTQAALAAGARGGDSALALNNAAANAAGVGGQLQQQLGLQRAQEAMANRQFSAQTLGAAGQAYGQAAGTQMGAYGGAASAYGNAGSVYGNAGALGLQGAGQMGNIATQNAGNALQQTQLNQTYGLGSQQLGADYLKSQLQASAQADANRTQNVTNLAAGQFANRDRSGEGTITGSAGGDKMLGTGLQVGGTALMMSDLRAKKDIDPAPAQVSDAFRAAGQAVSDIGGATVQYPGSTATFPNVGGYSYEYKNPSSLGAAPGTHYGPMAQELEQTPAGASVVGEDKKGRKFVDPGRLTMLNTAELAKQRRELDALKSIPAAIGAPRVVYPQTSAPQFPSAGIPDLHEAMALGGQIRNTQVPYPTPAPVYRLGGV
jgi:hypothetical protein